jgi:hypothetical protein
VRDVLSDDRRREELVQAGVARAAQFRWADTVDRYHEILLTTAATRV